MVNVLGGVAASVVSASLVAIGLASPASADDFEGLYTIDMSGQTATWAVTPCAGGDQFIPCVHVSQTGGEMAPWQADAHLGVGYWTLYADRTDTIGCDDGSKHGVRTTYSWDAVTLSGNLGAQDPGVCGGEARSLSAPFTLTKIGPPPEMAPPPPPPEPAPDITPPPDMAPGAAEAAAPPAPET